MRLRGREILQRMIGQPVQAAAQDRVAARVSPKANPVWKRFMANRSVTFVPDPMVRRSDRFFVMGSCFAEEIRLALTQDLGAGHVLPDLSTVAFDPAHAQADELPGRNHMNTYNAFSVLQEIERILGLWTPAPDDYWTIGEKLQCPYRRLVLADSVAAYAALCVGLDAALRAGFEAADHFIFTFGMTEIFVNKRSGKVASQKPGYGGAGGVIETAYHRATFAENFATISRLVDLITAAKPQARIFMTVSPVPLKLTFSGEDIFAANTLSKATLRTVLAEIAAAKPNVIYFPSYEAVMAAGETAWEGDGRHVLRPEVESITRAFVQSYFLPEATADQPRA